ncbi:hypothetical protein [Microcoleus vaginatus]|nr:hypothetical protein [Microcoleus sp. FACHB-84]MBD2008895.1 hypothetical protein [Microcoleus sp. FACHB-45]
MLLDFQCPDELWDDVEDGRIIEYRKDERIFPWEEVKRQLQEKGRWNV